MWVVLERERAECHDPVFVAQLRNSSALAAERWEIAGTNTVPRARACVHSPRVLRSSPSLEEGNGTSSFGLALAQVLGLHRALASGLWVPETTGTHGREFRHDRSSTRQPLGLGKGLGASSMPMTQDSRRRMRSNRRLRCPRGRRVRSPWRFPAHARRTADAALDENALIAVARGSAATTFHAPRRSAIGAVARRRPAPAWRSGSQGTGRRLRSSCSPPRPCGQSRAARHALPCEPSDGARARRVLASTQAQESSERPG